MYTLTQSLSLFLHPSPVLMPHTSHCTIKKFMTHHIFSYFSYKNTRSCETYSCFFKMHYHHTPLHLHPIHQTDHLHKLSTFHVSLGQNYLVSIQSNQYVHF